ECVLRVIRRHNLGDHAAHRGADDVSLLDAQGVEQADGIPGHVTDRVRQRCRLPRSQRLGDRLPIGRTGGLIAISPLVGPHRVCRTGTPSVSGFPNDVPYRKSYASPFARRVHLFRGTVAPPDAPLTSGDTCVYNKCVRQRSRTTWASRPAASTRSPAT